MAHRALKHTATRSYQKYIRQELEAHQYTWSKFRKPQHITSYLLGIFYDCKIQFAGLNQDTLAKILNFMRAKLFSLDIPDTWKYDYNEIESYLNSET